MTGQSEKPPLVSVLPAAEEVAVVEEMEPAIDVVVDAIDVLPAVF